MVAKFQESRIWLFWTGLFLASLMIVVLSASGLESSQALTAGGGIEISKTVNMPSAVPNQAPAPLYTITFSNSNTTEAVLTVITDTLPPGFKFIGLHPTSQWPQEPVDNTEPEIVWVGPITIPAKSTLSLVYSVDIPAGVPPRAEKYVNTAEAVTEGGADIGPATAAILIGFPDLSVQKTGWPGRVVYGEMVTYTVVFANSGYVTGTLDVISDTLDPSLTFVAMADGSDVLTPPQEISGSLVWTDTFDVPPLGDLTLRYKVQTSGGPGWSWPINHVEAEVDGEKIEAEYKTTVGPDIDFVYLPSVFKTFSYARLVISKSAFPTAATTEPGETVTYTVTIANVGDTTGTLLTVHDTLPPGFTWEEMAPTSDVTDPPSGSTGPISWEGPWVMPPGSQKQLVYLVSPNGVVGSYTNFADVTASKATLPREPASATITLDEIIAGLTADNDSPMMQGNPTTLSASVTAGSDVAYAWDFGDETYGSGKVVAHTYTAEGTYTATVTASNKVSQDTATTVVTIQPALLLEEHFEDGIGRWTKFLNYWRLTEEQWYWGAHDGFNGSGAITHDCTLGKSDPLRGAEDGLVMYLAPGAEEWTDYRVETKLLLRGGISEDANEDPIFLLEGGYPVGLWVRGQYEDVGSDDTAGWVTGYYVVIGGKPDKQMYVRLAQLQTLTDCWDNACNNPHNLYDFNNPHTLLQNKLDISFKRNQWYTLAVEVRGDHIMVWVNGIPAIDDYVDMKEPFLTGTVGFKTYKSWTVSFDDIIVTPLD